MHSDESAFRNRNSHAPGAAANGDRIPFVIDAEHAEPAGTETQVPDSTWRNKSQLSRLRLRQKKNVALVTTASYSASENRRKRQRQYAIMQGARIPFILLSAFAYMYLHNVLLATVLFIISVPLPWISVVIANGVGEPRDSRTPNVYKPAAARYAAEALATAQAAAIHNSQDTVLEIEASPASSGTVENTSVIIDVDNEDFMA
ncbi:DUF3099 domain-containing protein [Corynebacterium sp. HS2168-gen11]|uniref:DUF3099 domain-containing protein n=1 Tax=Corynebacterium sp. HS2168-gen11 TaxID=2974027 RepID=UPI00216ADF11|nr:DUF3099 domain-containing protein [Corynebacterium sp. HS2168-gen11]MCS4535231.1 DUF3099 domain-containing protein [Corynebacterium sp. HS2168-gen11]